MERLHEKFLRKIDNVNLSFVRDYANKINWNNRLIGLKGARGVGKTTLLLQHIKEHLPQDNRTIYVSLDDIYFSANTLIDFVDKFVKNGGIYLFLDEVHRYKNWSIELKNIYDDYPDLKIVYTGSSIIHLKKSGADLSRRAVLYSMNGLSFREFILFTKKTNFPLIDLSHLLENHIDISRNIIKKIKPIALFNNYLKIGYYPYFKESIEDYNQKLAETINIVLEVDIPNMGDINFSSISKLKMLLYIIATSAPFKPNIQKLSERTGITRNTIIHFLNYLNDAQIINLLNNDAKGISMLQKPEKIYLHHPNLQYALAPENINIGSMRESFFYNQVSSLNKISYTKNGDFLVNNMFTFEIGGKNKSKKQIALTENAFVAADNIEIGYNNQIPLWLFGFLY
jgi:predicted AAA+ superfamily ATPase